METCSVCGKQINVDAGETAYYTSSLITGTVVFCLKHWIEAVRRLEQKRAIEEQKGRMN
jgi:hypothetical protein